MTIRYCGPGGNDASDGLSYANRKLTLNGLEDSPVAAGDVCYISPGTYRELLTCDVSGSSGSPITYIGDYTGANTDGIGGLVRITGSDNDIVGARNGCISVGAKNFRTFRGFSFDTPTANNPCVRIEGGTDSIIDECSFVDHSYGIYINGSTQARMLVSNCFFYGGAKSTIEIIHSATVDNSAHVISNCIFVGGAATTSSAIAITRVGGITIKNINIISSYFGIYVAAVPAAGQTITVNNSTLIGCRYAFYSASTGFIVENYNNLSNNGTDRTNVDVGANSLAYCLMYDTRWFFEMVNGGNLVSPFDLASYSQLINVAGTSPTAADMRGTTVQGTQREWGALEYDSTLDIKAGTGGGTVIKNVPIPVFLHRRNR